MRNGGGLKEEGLLFVTLLGSVAIDGTAKC
jgi:hypothetical protein